MKTRNAIIVMLFVSLVVVSGSFYFYTKAQRKQLRGQAEFYIADGAETGNGMLV